MIWSKSFRRIRNPQHRSDRLRLEVLEDRRLLAKLDMVSALDWQGHTVDWIRGEWILECVDCDRRVDSATGFKAGSLLQQVTSRGINASAKNLYHDLWLLRADGLSPAEMTAIAADDPAILAVEPNLAMSPDEWIPNDPQFSHQWHLRNDSHTARGQYVLDGQRDNDNDATKAWDITTGSSSVVVAVIDSGIDYNHPDLINNIWSNPHEIPDNGDDDDGNGRIDDVRGWDFADDDNDPMDFYHHGTAVAGVIGAEGNNGIGIAGVAPDVSLLPLKISTGTTSVYSEAAAIASVGYLVDLKQRLGINVVAANMSFSCPAFNPLFFDVLDDARTAGIVFSASAGNLGGNSDLDGMQRYPASYELDNVMAVASINQGGFLAATSNRGVASVDLAAPGVDIRTTFDSGFRSCGGTSFAAPQVAGAVAILASDPESSIPLNVDDEAYSPLPAVAKIREVILEGVVPSQELSLTTAAGGRLNLFNSLQLMRQAFTVVQVSLDDQVLGTSSQIIVRFSEDVDASSFVASNMSLTMADTDGKANSTQDVVITPVMVELTDFNTGRITFAEDLGPGNYQLTLGGQIRQSGGGLFLNGGHRFTHDFVIDSPTGVLEHNDSLSTATDIGLVGSGIVSVDDLFLCLGDGYYGAADVDLFAFDVISRSRFRSEVTTQLFGTSLLDPYLCLFDENGAEVAHNDDQAYSRDSLLDLVIEDPGRYFVGVSGVGNTEYDPRHGGSGNRAFGVASIMSPVESWYEISFELTPLPSTGIAGRLWHDFDADRELDPGVEPGLQGWTVFLDHNGDDLVTPGEPVASSLTTGEFHFSGQQLSGGHAFRVAVQPPLRWIGTTPTSQEVKLPQNAWVDGIDFGFRLAPTEFPSLVVTNLDDLVRPSGGYGGPQGLAIREAIELAHRYPEIDTIAFDAALSGRSISLWKGQLEITGTDLVIQGPGAERLTLSAAGVRPFDPVSTGRDRVLLVDQDASLTMSGITLADGFAPRLRQRSTTAAASGGGVYVAGALDINDVVIRNNNALEDGGGLYVSETGYFTANRTFFADNSSISFHGRWLQLPDSNCSLHAGGGGGIANAGVAFLEDSWFQRNIGAHGGGIYTTQGSQTYVQATTISENKARLDGGGLRVLYGDVVVTNSTIAANFNPNPSAAKGITYGHGGGVAFGGAPDTNSNTANLDLTNTTIVNNEVISLSILGATYVGRGGGIYLGSENQVRLRNSIVADNLSPLATGRDIQGMLHPELASLRNNVVGIRDGSNISTDPSYQNQYGTDVSPLSPQLGPFVRQGGFGPTCAPLAGSPAIDSGHDPLTVGISDQLGFARHVDGDGDAAVAADVGAVESAGDFDRSDQWDHADIDRLIAEIVAARHNAAFDLTEDALVDLDDRDRWLAIAGAKRLDTHRSFPVGDTNLDGTVDDVDLGVWHTYKFTDQSAWSHADFNSDGVVDGRDFHLWNEHRGEVAGNVVCCAGLRPAAMVGQRPSHASLLPERPNTWRMLMAITDGDRNEPHARTNYRIADLNAVTAIACPCGTTRRTFLDDPDRVASLHVVEVTVDARTHYHRQTTEIYYVLEGRGRIELDGDSFSVCPGTAILIKPGCRHRAVGDLKILNVPIPAFDPDDEWFD